MQLRNPFLFACLFAAPAVICAQPVAGAPQDAYQVAYVSNLQVLADSYIDMTNAGSVSGVDPSGTLCVNVYIFSPAASLLGCCACPVTPNGLKSLSVKQDLVSNNLTIGTPSAITVSLLASRGNPGVACNAASPTAETLRPGLRAWATTLHASPNGQYRATENAFQPALLTVTELNKLTAYCGFIQAIGSGYGICRSCRTGGLGAVAK